MIRRALAAFVRELLLDIQERKTAEVQAEAVTMSITTPSPLQVARQQYKELAEAVMGGEWRLPGQGWPHQMLLDTAKAYRDQSCELANALEKFKKEQEEAKAAPSGGGIWGGGG